ncbi:hypothetical protein KY290_024232 [Solanum tuberosum]|uniref:Retrotransposon Copia-like N-terminal domain-containing protein n=1 Tax=Solanum tuberosum TaxID=4113 RepID=A0ABQ7UQ43_SOLTU|nr:hypothetical protein KY290_024232 [Solanum tuberosum]
MVSDDKNKTKDGVTGSGSNKTPMNDPTSPYFLLSADHTGICITLVVLKGDNYDEWDKAMRNTFRAKKKLGFIDRLITQPKEEEFELDDWYAVNSMLIAWVFNTIDPSLRSMISYMVTVKELWEDLREQFSVGNDMRIHKLKSELASRKQGGQIVAAYYGKLKSKWEELVGYTKNPICICVGCICGAAKELAQERENVKVNQFLMGLDDEVFGTTRSNILSTEPLPTLNRVYAMIIQ